MKGRGTAAFGLCLLMLLSIPHAHAQDDGDQEKLAQTGMKFLSVSLDPRAAGMGDAMTAVEGGAAMLFYNPAGMARLESAFSVLLGQTQWIAEIDYNLGSIAFRPFGGRYGVVGFSVMAVDYGDLQQTVRFDNEQGFLDLGTFSPTAWSVGVGYARALTDRFSVGAHVKFANQNLGDSVMEMEGESDFVFQSNEEGVLAYDFGMLYRTGFRSLNFAVSARNFAREIEYEEESFQLPLSLKIGVAMDMIDFTSFDKNTHSLLLAVDAEHPRDFAEQLKIGGEYTFLNTFSLRAGYIFPTDEQGINLGAGFRQRVAGIGFAADYAYTSFGIFSEVHRLAFQLSL